MQNQYWVCDCWPKLCCAVACLQWAIFWKHHLTTAICSVPQNDASDTCSIATDRWVTWCSPNHHRLYKINRSLKKKRQKGLTQPALFCNKIPWIAFKFTIFSIWSLIVCLWRSSCAQLKSSTSWWHWQGLRWSQSKKAIRTKRRNVPDLHWEISVCTCLSHPIFLVCLGKFMKLRTEKDLNMESVAEEKIKKKRSLKQQKQHMKTTGQTRKNI